MKKQITITLLILIVIILGYILLTQPEEATAPLPQQTSQETSCNPDFSEYAIEREIYQGEIAEVDFDTYPDARTFQTRIREGVSEGANFAGNYAIASWGCGTNCQGHAIVNVENGSILPIPLVSWFDISYSPTSTLLIVNPQENIPAQSDLFAEVTTEYLSLEDNALVPICETETKPQETPIPFYSPSPGESWGSGETCVQVVVVAQEDDTGILRQFPTPCHVPDGWTVVDR